MTRVAELLPAGRSNDVSSDHAQVMLRLAKDLCRPVHRFMDIGFGDGVLAAALLGELPRSHGGQNSR
jgi:methylase of polypeptide subunit release factors